VLEDRTLLSGPEIVRDVNESAVALDWEESYRPIQLRALGSKVIYWAYPKDSSSDYLLICSDGTGNRTETVLKFKTVGELVVAGDWLYFSANDGVSGEELWKTDGTREGTQLVRDISPGPGGGVGELAAIGNQVFFGAFTPATGFELWKSDGTAAGTVLVKDIQTGPGGSGVAELTRAGNRVFFSADDGARGRELWSSDGTAAGTLLVKDIAPGSASGLNPYPRFSVAGDLVYFVGNDGVHGREPWRTDGTTAGTTLVQDIFPGVNSSLLSYSQPFVLSGDSVYFSAADNVHGRELWKTNGTNPGAVLVADIVPGAAGSDPYEMTILGGQIFFSAIGSTVGRELWKTDGTAAGTVLFADLRPGYSSSEVNSLFEFNGELFLQHFDHSGNYLTKTDGVAPPSVVFRGYGWQFTKLGNELFFLGGDGVRTTDLWKTDGTTAGTVQASFVFPGQADSLPRYLTAANGLLYFGANDGISGQELWRSDGTWNGTFRLGDFFPGSGWSTPSGVAFDGQFYFTLRSGTNRGDLYKTDGTVAGTVLVKDFNSSVSASPSSFTVLNGQLFFVMDDGVNGRALWRTDGTTAGTVIVRDAATGSVASNPFTLMIVNGRLYFGATDAFHGREIWSTDGTDAGTAVIDAVAGPGSRPILLLGSIGSDIYFQGAQSATHAELWVTDGTVAGTRLVKDILSGTTSQNLSGFRTVGSHAYFLATGSGVGRELWITDGTTAGTRMVKDIEPGTGGIQAQGVGVFGSIYVFNAVTSVHGAELWRTDGTEAGTFKLTDLDAGTSSLQFNPLYSSSALSIVFVRLENSKGQLWRTDGTSAGTYLLKDLGSNGTSTGIVEYGGRYFFVGRDSVTGLWVTDGTVAGTRQLSQTDPKASGASLLTLVGSRLYFAAETDVAGSEVMSIDLATDPVMLTLQAGLVAENTAPGTTVGRLEWLAAGPAGSLTYSLVPGYGDQDNSRVSIVGDQIVVAGPLDYEAKGSLSIRVRATNPSGASVENDLHIALVDVNEAPTAIVHTLGFASFVENRTPPQGFSGSIVVTDDALGTNILGLSGPDAGDFQIIGTGLYFRGTSLDYEIKSRWDVVITVNDPTIGGPVDASTTFTFVISDVNEYAITPIADSNLAPNSIAENSPEGSVVGLTAFASDADGSLNAITYSLLDSAGGRFVIHPTTGVVTVAPGAALNYEAVQSHTINVQARSADGSTATRSFVIDVLEVDEFDVGPVADINLAPNSVLERSAVGTPVGITAYARDADGTNSGITYMLWDTRGGRFAIDAVTGVVTVANSELLDHAANSVWAIRILAISQDGSFSFKDDTITVARNNVFSVSPVTDTNPVANSISENTVNGTTVGITAYAVDADAFNNAVSYSLTNTAGGRFTINATTGIVTVANASLLNYETAASHAIIVRATSQDGSFSEQSFTINLTDVDEFDVGEITDSNAAPNSVPEHSAVGTPVGITAFASDADGTNSAITYSLWDTRGGRFAIDPVTGVVTVANSALLDQATDPLWAIRVLAISQDGSYGFKDFTIDVASNNAFSVSSVSDNGPAANVVSESAVNGTTVGITAYAFDADSFNNTVSYSLTNTAGGRFAIHATTGVVTVANASLLNHETAASHVIVVRATSSDGSFSDQPFTINVSDVDEFDVGPITDTNTAANSVSERSAAGTPVGITAFASDADGTNSGITYMLWDTRGGRFAINSATGVVTVANPALLNRATDPLWSIRVLAISQDGSFSFRDFTIAIT
jgi:ELWxxDGT repeat protein